jgi:hypothetical protein
MKTDDCLIISIIAIIQILTPHNYKVLNEAALSLKTTFRKKKQTPKLRIEIRRSDTVKTQKMETRERDRERDLVQWSPSRR